MLRNPVADTQKRISIVTVLAALVDLKFHAEITLAVTVKYRVGFIVVFVDRTLLAFLITPVAIGVIVLIIVVGVVPMNNAPTTFAGRVVIIVTRIAERHAISACIIVSPDSVAAMRAFNRFTVKTQVTQDTSVELIIIIVSDILAAAIADKVL